MSQSATNQVEKVGRGFRDAEQNGVGARVAACEAADRSRLRRLEIGKPICETLFGLCRRGEMRAIGETSSQTTLLRAVIGGRNHAAFCGTSGIWAASLSLPVAGNAMVARSPGPASVN